MIQTLSRVLTLIGILMVSIACSTKFIPGTKIEDSDESRQVIKTVETYRKAMERRDADMLIALASKNYFEKNGDTNSKNNYDYAGLVRFLRSSEFRKITDLRLTILYKSLTFNEARNVATVKIYYTVEFKMPPIKYKVTSGPLASSAAAKEKPKEEEPTLPNQPKEETPPAGPSGAAGMTHDNYDEEVWHSKSDDNEMVLELVDGRWYFLKGM